MSCDRSEGFTGQRFSQTIQRFREELDRLTEYAWNRGEGMWEQLRPHEGSGDWSPEIDIVETEESVIVFANLPGIQAEKANITLVGNTLEITANFDSLTLQPSDRVHRRERPTGKLHRVINLPVSVDFESALAQAENGVLKIEMKKSIDKRAYKVPVVVNASCTPGTADPAAPPTES